ncbi:MAG: hypothetical protein RL134_2515 [Actinomycetota bacterium]|jgi:hypothetical protein
MSTERVSVGCDRCSQLVEDGGGHRVGEYRVCAECAASAWAAATRERVSVQAAGGVSVERVGAGERWPHRFLLAWEDEGGRAWRGSVEADSESAARQAWIDGDLDASHPLFTVPDLAANEVVLHDPYTERRSAWVRVDETGLCLRPVGTHPDNCNLIVEAHSGHQVRIYTGTDAERVYCFNLKTGAFEGVES